MHSLLTGCNLLSVTFLWLSHSTKVKQSAVMNQKMLCIFMGKVISDWRIQRAHSNGHFIRDTLLQCGSISNRWDTNQRCRWANCILFMLKDLVASRHTSSMTSYSIGFWEPTIRSLILDQMDYICVQFKGKNGILLQFNTSNPKLYPDQN